MTADKLHGGRAGSVLVGFLVGGAAGFLLAESVGAFSYFLLDRSLDVGTGALRTLFFAVPAVCGLIGAVLGARRAGRPHPDQTSGK